jgi:hypothetical protein
VSVREFFECVANEANVIREIRFPFENFAYGYSDFAYGYSDVACGYSQLRRA